MTFLEDKIDSFFSTFNPTFELVDFLISAKSHPQEIIILTCSRLDALATTSCSEKFPRRNSFISFITNYGQQRKFFKKVSVGDLYRIVAYNNYLVSADILIVGGRFYRYNRDNDAMLTFIDYSDIPLEKKYVQSLLTKIMHALTFNYRVKHRQSLSKSHLANKDEVLDYVMQSIHQSRLKEYYDSIKNSMSNLINTQTIAGILYERFRSEVIHGGYIQLDMDKFFKEESPYWSSWYTDIYGSFLVVEFPAKYLKNLLIKCINTYKNHLIKKDCVPAGIHWQVFGDDPRKYLDYFDTDSVDMRWSRLRFTKLS